MTDHDPIREKCVCYVKPSDICSVHSDEALMKKSAEIEEWRKLYNEAQDGRADYARKCDSLTEKLKQAEADLRGEKTEVNHLLSCNEACNKEIESLTSQVKMLTKKLETAERALLIESSEPEERSQEANHYGWLDAQNEILTQKLEIAKSTLKEISCVPNHVELDSDAVGQVDEMCRLVKQALEKLEGK